jgi:hypothetical protein
VVIYRRFLTKHLLFEKTPLKSDHSIEIMNGQMLHFDRKRDFCTSREKATINRRTNK